MILLLYLNDHFTASFLVGIDYMNELLFVSNRSEAEINTGEQRK